MSRDHNSIKKRPPETKTERELLELRVDQKMTETKQALVEYNRIELQRIASEIHEPKLKRVLKWSALREEYTRSIEPARARAAETLKLERTLNDLVNQAYGLTPAKLPVDALHQV
jgi:hypothetical protein